LGHEFDQVRFSQLNALIVHAALSQKLADTVMDERFQVGGAIRSNLYGPLCCLAFCNSPKSLFKDIFLDHYFLSLASQSIEVHIEKLFATLLPKVII